MTNVKKKLILPNVSRETFQSLRVFYDILMHWNKTIALTEDLPFDQYYERHICDGLQLFRLVSDEPGKVVDLGSGCGIPAIPMAIMGIDVCLVESVAKKAYFLNHVIKQLNLSGSVVNKRIEELFYDEKIIVTARALKSLKILLGYCYNVSRETIGFFIKGARYLEEIQEAKKMWQFDYEVFDGVTAGVVIKVKNIERKK
ncbi:MAG: Ribosomal RNA small subunit methyltransferase G [Holosporales bacterium]